MATIEWIIAIRTRVRQWFRLIRSTKCQPKRQKENREDSKKQRAKIKTISNDATLQIKGC